MTESYEWAQPPPPPPRLGPPHLRDKLLDLDTLLNMPEPEWLIEKILPSGALVIAFGEPGHFKSFAALDWSLCVATGTKWAGLECKQGPVIYVIAEGVSGTPKRVRAWMNHHEIKTIPDARWLPCAVNLTVTTEVAQLLQIVQERQPRLVIIDTLARNTMGAEENSSKDMGIVIGAATSFIESCECTVVIVHHTVKDKTIYRGSTALAGAADAMWLISHEGLGIVKFTNTKQKDSICTDDFVLQAVEMYESAVLCTVSSSSQLKAAEKTVLDTLAKVFDQLEATPNQLALATELQPKTLQRILSSLVRHGFIENVGSKARPRYILTEPGTGQVDN